MVVVGRELAELMFQYKRSIYQKSGIAQSVYVPQGFSPVTFTTGPTAQWGRLRKEMTLQTDSLHGHMTTSITNLFIFSTLQLWIEKLGNSLRELLVDHFLQNLITSGFSRSLLNESDILFHLQQIFSAYNQENLSWHMGNLYLRSRMNNTKNINSR